MDLICELTDGWLMPRRSAARRKLPSSATATKTSSLRKVSATPPPSLWLRQANRYMAGAFAEGRQSAITDLRATDHVVIRPISARLLLSTLARRCNLFMDNLILSHAFVQHFSQPRSPTQNR